MITTTLMSFNIPNQVKNVLNTTQLRLNDLVCSPLEGKIPCLEFTIEIQSNNLMYNPNKEIRNREFPIKIGKFSVKYYNFDYVGKP